MQKDLHKIIDGADKWQMDQVNAKLCIGKTNLKCLLQAYHMTGNTLKDLGVMYKCKFKVFTTLAYAYNKASKEND